MARIWVDDSLCQALAIAWKTLIKSNKVKFLKKYRRGGERYVLLVIYIQDCARVSAPRLGTSFGIAITNP